MRRGLRPDDIYRLALISDVQLSPDGRRIAYTVKRACRDLQRFRSRIHLIDVETGQSWPATEASSDALSPRWAPDSRRLAFLSDRDGRAINLFCLDAEVGGDARQLTGFYDDVSVELTYPVISDGYVWSPLGDRLCVSVKSGYDPFAGRPYLRYEKLRYKSGENGWWDHRRRHLWTVAADGSAASQLTDGDWDAYGPAFAPDGRTVAFSSSRSFGTDMANTLPDTNPFAGKDIWLIPADRSAPARRLTDGDGPNMTPSFSPDGLQLAYFGHRHGVVGWAQNTHLWRRPVAGPGEPVDLLRGWDFTAGSHVLSDVHDVMAPPPAVWTPDGAELLFHGTVRGAANLFRVDREGELVVPVTDGDHELQLVSLSADATRFAALRSDGSAPSDVYVGSCGDGAMRRLTTVNDEFLSGIYIADVARHTVPVDGKNIDCFVLAPPASDRRPALLAEVFPSFCCGRSFNFEQQMFAGMGMVVVSANTTGATSYGEAWLAGSFVHGQYFADTSEWLGLIDAMVARTGADSARVGITGDAYGGMMTSWIVTQSSRFRAACTRRGAARFWPPGGDRFAGLSPDSRETTYSEPEHALAMSAITRVNRITTPMMIVETLYCARSGTADGEELFAALRALGKPARLMLLKSSHHFMVRTSPPDERAAFFTEVGAWFDEYLNDPAGFPGGGAAA